MRSRRSQLIVLYNDANSPEARTSSIKTIFECTKTMRENYPDQDNINRIEEVESYKDKIVASIEELASNGSNISPINQLRISTLEKDLADINKDIAVIESEYNDIKSKQGGRER